MPEDSPVRDVVLMLGSFHTLMNLVGAIGTLMDGSEIKEILGTIYGDNAVQHIMTGKAIQRAVRGHLLLDQCLTQKVADKVLCDHPGFADQLQELEQLSTCKRHRLTCSRVCGPCQEGHCDNMSEEAMSDDENSDY